MTTPFRFALAAAFALPAQAHITLEQPQAPAGSAYKAVLRVGHGCAGGLATHTLTVRIPAGFRGAKPMPKPGWLLSIQRSGDEVAEISWRAASRDSWLPDANYDEFVLRGQTPVQPGPLWFKVLQQCEQGQTDWAELPASGTATRGLKSPAALLDVLPGELAGHQH